MLTSEQITNKNYQFHQEIRQKQHKKIFTKVRQQNKERELFLSTTAQDITKLLLQLQPRIHSIETLYDNEALFMDFINYLKRMDNVPTGGLMEEALEMICRVSRLIHEHGRMDVERGMQEEEGDGFDGPFGTFLMRISTFLVNFLAESDETVIEYLEPLKYLLKHRENINSFYNLLLNKLLPTPDRNYFLNLLLTHLEEAPSFYLQNLHKYTPILYYGTLEPLVQDEDLCHRTIKVLVNQFTLLELVKEEQKINDFRELAYEILSKMCYGNRGNCELIVGGGRSEFLFSDLAVVVGELRRLLINNKDTPKNMKMTKMANKNRVYEQIDKQHIITGINLLINLFQYDELVVTIIEKKSVTLWLYILEIFMNLGYAPLGMAHTMQRILRLICNAIVIPSLCYDFITYKNQSKRQDYQSQSKHEHQHQRPYYPVIATLNQLFTWYHSSSKAGLKVELLNILNNMVAVVCKQIKIGSCQEEGVNENMGLLGCILEECREMVHEMLNVGREHAYLILCILKNFTFMLENYGNDFKPLAASVIDSEFVRKVRRVAEGDLEEYTAGIYDQETIMQAGELLELLHNQEL